MTQNKKNMIKKLILTAGVLLFVVAIVLLVMHLTGLDKLTREELQEFISSKGAIAPLIYIAISFLQVTFVPIPGAITILAGNYIFGTWGAFIYSYIGMLLGAMFAYLLGKLIGRPFANWLAGGKEKVDEWLMKLKGRENVLLFFMFFFPFFPDDVLCTVAGLLPISWLGFLIMQLITRATSVLGTLFFMSGEIIPWTTWWGITILVLVALFCIFAFFVAFINAERINNWFNGIFRKVYYGEKNFRYSLKGEKAGIATLIGKKIIVEDKKWVISTSYKTNRGYVVDIYSTANKNNVPQSINFSCSLIVNNQDEIVPEHIFEHNYYGKHSNKAKENSKEVIKFMKHYKRDKKASRKFVRINFPYNKNNNVNSLYFVITSENGEQKKVNLIKKNKKGIKDVVDLVKGS